MWAKLLLLLVVIGAAGALLWMLFLPQVAAARVAQQSRFGVAIETFAANPFAGTVLLRGVTVENPLVFGPRDFIRLEAFEADAQVFTALRQRVVFDEVRIDLPLLAIVTNTDGTTNLDLFRDRMGGEAETIERTPARKFLIKRLHVRVGELRFVNLTARQPRERSMQLDFEHTFENISDWKQLLVPELFRRAAVAGGSFEGLVPEDFGRTVSQWSRRGGGLFREPTRRTTETMKSLFEKLEDSRKP